MDETYEVELLDQFELNTSAPELEDRSPYARYGRMEQTCGEGFDLKSGDTLTMKAVDTQQDLAGYRRACDACLYIDADMSADSIVRISDSERSSSIGDNRFSDIFDGAIDGNCRGSFRVGIMPIDPVFLANSDRHVQTDHMLFREFRELDVEACRRPGSKNSEVAPGCWDSWSVRIRDSSGAVKTRDIAEDNTIIGADAGG